MEAEFARPKVIHEGNYSYYIESEFYAHPGIIAIRLDIQDKEK